jgi:Protein of unknown function (DUF3152)
VPDSHREGPPPDHRYQRGRRTSHEPLSASWEPLAANGRSTRSTDGRRRGFLRTYGWLAYALPVLVALTALTVFNTGRFPLPGSVPFGPEQPEPARPERIQLAAPGLDAGVLPDPPTPLVPNPDAPGFAEAKASAELPAGGVFTEAGLGTWSVVPGVGPQLGTGQLFTYSVELENGVELLGGPEGLVQIVDATLANPKSWIGSGKYAFQRVDIGEPDIRISLASQQTARQVCGFRIPFDASCWRGGRVVLNTARWERGAVAFQGNVIAYQQYVVNHEVGHALGFKHKPCGEIGVLAPIMMQQTWGVSNDYLAALGTDNVIADGKTCAPNPWPYPAPG